MIGVIAHSSKSGASRVVHAVCEELRSRGLEFLADEGAASLGAGVGATPLPEVAARSSLLLVMGGDGTILRVVHSLPAPLPPIFGINIGSLGFLTCAGPGEIRRAIESVIARDYLLSERTLLAAEFQDSSGAVVSHEALNDIVISRGERSRLVKIRVEIDGGPLTDYNADGLVISTPTGSTAYSLSAGGPILLPDCGAFVVTPICPHVLTNRSTVVSDTSVIRLSLLVPDQEVFFNIDGQVATPIGVGDTLTLSKSSQKVSIAMLPERSFSEVLRQKLKWSGSNV